MPKTERNTSSQEQKEKDTTKDQTKGKDSAEIDTGMKESKPEGVALPPNLMKAIRRRSSSVIGSTSSNGGSGNNSDNSGLVSIGNNSFGFNFDSEEGMNSNSASDGKTNESDSGEDTSPPGTSSKMNTDSAHGSETSEEAQKPKAAATVSSLSSEADSSKGAQSASSSDWKSSVSSLTESSTSEAANKTDKKSHEAAAAAVVASLQSIASQHEGKSLDWLWNEDRDWHVGVDILTMFDVSSSILAEKKPPAKKSEEPSMTNKSLPPFANRKRPADDQDTGGYNSEADGEPAVSCSTATRSSTRSATSNAVVTRSSKRPVPTQTSSQTNVESTAADAATVVPRGGRSKKKAKKALDDSKREERNAREKERSYRISKQINELRNLLSSGGVIVPKGTKSSVLTEAANYIRMLQQHQYRSEMYVLVPMCTDLCYAIANSLSFASKS